MGAIVLEDRAIGAGSLVGAGSVVTRDVPDRTQVQGVPARVVRSDIDPP
jgi:acetyltransferase-like isoleucine patch superfamily enzyme